MAFSLFNGFLFFRKIELHTYKEFEFYQEQFDKTV